MKNRPRAETSGTPGQQTANLEETKEKIIRRMMHMLVTSVHVTFEPLSHGRVNPD